MAVNLIDKLRTEFTDDAIGRIATFVGETPANTQSAIGYAVPATVGMLAQKAQTPQGAADLFETMQRGGFDKAVEGIGSLLRTGTPASDSVKADPSLLSSLFGARQTDLADLMVSRTGIRPQSATSLLALIAPLVLHSVRREATASGGFNVSSVARLLGDQLGFVRNIAPPGLASMLGVSGPEEPAGAHEARRAESARADEATHEPARGYARPVHAEPARAYDRGRGLGWLKWAIPLLLVGLVVWGLTAFRHREPNRDVAATAATPVGTAGTVALVKQRLSCGQELDVAPNGVERQLVSFIDDSGRRIDKETWFTFDRLEFDTGSANLTASSQPQIRNIAAILQCYPNVTLKFGGYTDNTGDPAANQRLSQARAENARQAVISQGIDQSRIEAEGYGQEHPVASNDAGEGRQRNRRIDILVIKK
jgi:outer membrane protein OmpA-like peptidoglycan-associated protein